MDIMESHFEESKEIIVARVNRNILPIDESNKNVIEVLIERLKNVEKSQLLEVANERLKDFEEKLKNLSFDNKEVEKLAEEYKEKLVEFITSGLREYLQKK